MNTTGPRVLSDCVHGHCGKSAGSLVTKAGRVHNPGACYAYGKHDMYGNAVLHEGASVRCGGEPGYSSWKAEWQTLHARGGDGDETTTPPAPTHL